MQENMRRAKLRDAVNKEMFYFRHQLVPEDDDDEEPTDQSDLAAKSHDHEYTLMSINTIMNGKACDHR